MVIGAEEEKVREGWEHGWVSLPKEDGSLVSRRGGPDKVSVDIFKKQYRIPVPSGDKFLLNWGHQAELKHTPERNDGVVLQVYGGEDGKPRVFAWCFERDFLNAMNSLKKPKLKV